MMRPTEWRPIFCRLPVCAGLLLLSVLEAHAWRSSLYPEDWQPGFTDGMGRFLHDFSYAGYRRGEAAIPENPPGPTFDVTQAPYNADNTGASDATAAIQQAIDDAGTAGGGVVYFPPGTYPVAPQGSDDFALRIRDSGVVLRGAGPGQTLIHNTETSMRQKEVIKFRPSSGDWATALSGTTRNLSADLGYPETVVPLASVSGLAVGDRVVLRTDATDDFHADHGMNGIWDSSLQGVMFFREIIAVDSTNLTVTIDIPTRYYMKTRDNARVYKVSPVIEEVGVEDLSISMAENTTPGFGDNDYSVPGTGAYEVHNSHMIEFYHVLNGWAQRVESRRHPANPSDVHMLSMGLLMQRSRGITVRDCVFQKPLYEGGGGNGYMYRLRGNECLIQDSQAIHARHNFSFFSLYTSGNVIHRCLAKDGRLSTDFHGHLSMANLFDGTTVDGDDLEGVYRNAGTVIHGHSTTESVFWNTHGESASPVNIVESRQWGWGYVIGTRGPKNGVTRGTADNTAPEDFLEGEGMGDTLSPQSLYSDQLAQRLGVGAFLDIVRTDATGFVIQTETQRIYELQYTTDTNASPVAWTSTGAETTGDGEERVLFDPAGPSTQRTYRVIERP